MERTIMIGRRECRMKTSAALPRLYRRLLGKEIFEDAAAIGRLFGGAEEGEPLRIELDRATPEQLEALGCVEDLAYVMAKHADPAQPDTVEEWLEQFDDVGGVFDAVFDIVMLWLGETRQTSEDQKKTGPLTDG